MISEMIKYIHIVLAIWSFAVVAIFAEDYPNRPTAYEMQGLVVSGTQCARGMNERCWATQYQTNPVAYQVAPFTNTAFYLDQSLMGAMASKIKSLVPYYVDPDSVYDGTTNIVMLTFTGLVTSLQIGDGTNFTCIPAIGTNAATYGDDPWRIYIVNLQERHKVLNALKVVKFDNKVVTYGGSTRNNNQLGPEGTSYAASVSGFLGASWVETEAPVGFFAYMDSIDNTWMQSRTKGYFRVLGGYTTNLIANKIEAYSYLGTVSDSPFYGSDGVCPGNSNTYIRVVEVDYPDFSTFPYDDTTLYGGSDVPIPDGSPAIFYGWFLGWPALGHPYQTFITFDFDYCANNWGF